MPVDRQGNTVLARDDMPDLVIDLAFEGTLMNVRNALEEVVECLHPMGLEIEERGTVELVLAEVLNNVVEHAYAGRQPGQVRLSCHRDAQGLHFTVGDDGIAMPDGTFPLPSPDLLPVRNPDAAEGGFGWFLIGDLARDVTYRRKGGRNTLTFRIAVATDMSISVPSKT